MPLMCIHTYAPVRKLSHRLTLVIFDLQRLHPVNYTANGSRPITTVEFVQKGRSYQVLAADDVSVA